MHIPVTPLLLGRAQGSLKSLETYLLCQWESCYSFRPSYFGNVAAVSVPVLSPAHGKDLLFPGGE